MPERDGYIPGVPCWIDTSQPDPDSAASFYGDLFGWAMEDVMPPDADSKYFIGRIRGGDVAAVSSIPEGAPPMAMWNTYIWVDSVDETAAKVRDAGGTVMSEPFDVMEAGRMAVFADPEGAVFCVWQAKEHKGAKVVNENGALNFNTLETRDVEAAKRFYGAVFGWETLTLPGGAQMWTRPGYGDHLVEKYSPGLREQVEEVGGPEGFEDVVAATMVLGEDEGDIPAHWGVTFGADDTDALAERAAGLGGKVIAPPMDVPWSRLAVLADPAGATFTVSKFVPENKDLAG